MTDNRQPDGGADADVYRQQIQHYARTLAAARPDDLGTGLGSRFTAEQVRLFTDGNCEKREEKLLDHVDLLNEAWDDLRERVAAFVREVPPAAYDAGNVDAEEFLHWLERTAVPNDEQRDFLACQRGRNAVEAAARGCRMAHVRFQELLSVTDQLAGELETSPTLRVYLNPVRAWTEFRTPVLLGDEGDLPATVLFYPVDSDIRTAVLEPRARELLERLEPLSPCPLDCWLEATSDLETDREELTELTLDMSDLGLVALG